MAKAAVCAQSTLSITYKNKEMIKELEMASNWFSQLHLEHSAAAAAAVDSPSIQLQQ